jgi:hypothetical protein
MADSSAPREDELSTLGLGYGSTASAMKSVDDMMQSYLQQCLEYHEEQMKLKEQPKSFGSGTKEPIFVAKSKGRLENPSPLSGSSEVQEAVTKKVIQGLDQIVPQDPDCSQQTAPSALNAAAEAGAAKARAIIQKFHLIPPTADDLPPEDYRRRRLVHMTKEAQRLEAATNRNFAYLARKEEKRLEIKFQNIQDTHRLQEALAQQHAIQYQQRQHSIHQLRANQLAGIGTKQQRQQEARKQRDQKKMLQQHPNQNEAASIYLSNLPLQELDCNLIQQLFASYGLIRRVHLYRNKQTGELKGDGLVVFDFKDGNKSEFVQSVCQQVSDVCLLGH